MPVILTSRDDVRSVFAKLTQRPGLVPTMGALHAGHVSLIARSVRENAQTVVSIFINPTQFGNVQDLALYPRTLDADIELAAFAGATHIFAPTDKVVYGEVFDSWVEVPGLSEKWEGALRPGHFRGVCTVVSILLNLVQPRRAYFGEKDYQQLQIIQRMHEDLSLPGEIIGCATERDFDGVALSSRNRRLSPSGRSQAAAIPRALATIQNAAVDGESSTQQLVDKGRKVLHEAGIFVDYLAIVNARTLIEKQTINQSDRILVAVEIEGIRLIDNASVFK